MYRSKSVYIFGHSGHSRVVLDSMSKLNFEIKGYFDIDECDTNPFELKYFGFEKKLDIKKIVKNDFVFPTVGDNNLRKRLILYFKENELNQFNIIDPSAIVSKSVKIDKSSYIGPNSTLNNSTEISEGVIINTGSIIEHDCKINSYSQVGPGAVLCGNVTVGKNCIIGANSTVIQNISICDNVTLGAGGVAVKNISKKGVWVGNPIKKIKNE